MTKKFHKAEPYVPKKGIPHRLDTQADLCLCSHELTAHPATWETEKRPCSDCGCAHFNSRDFGKDEQRWARRGLAGVFDIRQLRGIQLLEADIDWHTAHADYQAPGAVSPLHRALSVEAVCVVAGLTEPQRQTMVCYLEGHSMHQVAELLGVSYQAVQTRLAWGRFKLKLWAEDILDARGLGK